MSDLRTIEQRAFRAARDDGLLDVMMAAFVSMFALAPLWSGALGEFWSSALFGPIWFGMYLIVRYLKAHFVAPRVGTMEPGVPRRRRLKRAGIVMTVVLAAMFGIGVVAARGFGSDWFDLSEFIYPIALGVTALIVFSLTAYALSIWRYYVYGAMVAVAPLVGEWLWQNDLAAHHGFPVAFGMVAIIMLTTGIIRFASVMRNHPVPTSAPVS